MARKVGLVGHGSSGTAKCCMIGYAIRMDNRRQLKEAEIASRCEEAHRLIDHILDELREKGWSQEDVFAIHVGLQEALSNAIKHGNRRDPQKKVRVRWLVEENLIEISVEDEGEGFDPGKVSDPTLPENLDRPDGRGLRLMQGFMDEVTFRKGGREIVMKRFRH